MCIIYLCFTVFSLCTLAQSVTSNDNTAYLGTRFLILRKYLTISSMEDLDLSKTIHLPFIQMPGKIEKNLTWTLPSSPVTKSENICRLSKSWLSLPKPRPQMSATYLMKNNRQIPVSFSSLLFLPNKQDWGKTILL